MIFLTRFLLHRLSQGVIIVLLISLLIFTLLRIVPGDPVRTMLGPMVTAEMAEKTAQDLGLRDPIFVQYARYMGEVLQGDLGRSFVRSMQGASTGGSRGAETFSAENRAPVAELIANTVPYSLALGGLAILFAFLVAAPLGLWAGLRPGSRVDRFTLYLSSLFVSMPTIWLGVVLIYLISARLMWLPAIGYQGPAYMILPAIVLAVELSPTLMRSIAVSIAQSRDEEFVSVARVRGMPKRQIFFQHVLRNASIPLLNLLGVQVAGLLLGGLFVVEFVFNYPGIGLLMINAVLQRDFPIIQAVAILACVALVLINILVDLAATSIDKRLQV